MRSWRFLAGAALFVAGCSQQQDGNAQPVDTAPVAAATEAGMGASDVNAAAPMVNDSAPEAAMPSSADASHATVVGSLKSELVGKGTLDGASITDVRLAGRCTTTFVTGKATVSIDWSKVGNFASSVQGGKATIPIDDGHGAHRFSLPSGAGARRVDGSMGLLADDCGGPM